MPSCECLIWLSHRASTILMVDVNDDANDKYRRFEVLTGTGRRRRWSADKKALIVAETLVPRARGSRAALADLFAAGIWSATHNAAGLVERCWNNDNDDNAWLRSDRERSHSAATVQPRRLPRWGSRSNLPCGGSGLVRHG